MLELCLQRPFGSILVLDGNLVSTIRVGVRLLVSNRGGIFGITTQREAFYPKHIAHDPVSVTREAHQFTEPGYRSC